MTDTHRLAITATGVGTAEVLLNGQDIANSLQSLTLDMGVGRTPTATLDLLLIDTTEVQDTETRILIPDTTRDALLALGWTAPADEPAPDATPTPDPLPPYAEVKAYRTDDGRTAWVFRCWGDGDCEGALHLDLDNQPYAEHKARRHVAAAHPAPATEPAL